MEHQSFASKLAGWTISGLQRFADAIDPEAGVPRTPTIAAARPCGRREAQAAGSAIACSCALPGGGRRRSCLQAMNSGSRSTPAWCCSAQFLCGHYGGLRQLA